MISSASASGESVPIDSASIWWNWRKRPACGRSCRKKGPTSTASPAAAACACRARCRRGRSRRWPRASASAISWSVKVNICFWTTSVDSPTPCANRSVSSKTGVSILRSRPSRARGARCPRCAGEPAAGPAARRRSRPGSLDLLAHRWSDRLRATARYVLAAARISRGRPAAALRGRPGGQLGYRAVPAGTGSIDALRRGW